MLTKSQRQQLRQAPLIGANKIADAMRLAGVTQVQIAEATGFTQPHVSRVRDGRYGRLPGETMRAFANFFGCQIEDLFPSREAVAR